MMNGPVGVELICTRRYNAWLERVVAVLCYNDTGQSDTGGQSLMQVKIKS